MLTEYGEVTEWLKVPVLKTGRLTPRGFESHPLRQHLFIMLTLALISRRAFNRSSSLTTIDEVENERTNLFESAD